MAVKVCAKLCKECPFSNKSMAGYLAEYSPRDFAVFMDAEKSFPCHMLLTEEDISWEEAQERIEVGTMKLCRGYVESYIKTCQSPKYNQQLKDAIKEVRETGGVSESTLSKREFVKYHTI